MRSRGFTLIEIMIVIIIIAILARIGIATYRGAILRADEALVKSDLKHNIERYALYRGQYGRYPTSVELSNDSYYKLLVSKRSTYKFLNYCSDQFYTEIVMSVGDRDGRMWYVSSKDNNIVDVSADYATAACFPYLQGGGSTGEWRAPIHTDGTVETGYVTITGP